MPHRVVHLDYGLTILHRALLGKLANVVEAIPETPQIVACDRLSGEDCMVARAHVRDVTDMETVIDRTAPFGATISCIVRTSPAEEPLLGL